MKITVVGGGYVGLVSGACKIPPVFSLLMEN
jgi:UDP-glucose 6-dehydrogenase